VRNETSFAIPLLKIEFKNEKENMVSQFYGGNMKCDICGKTVKDALSHQNKHVCKECYSDIFSKNKDEQ
jgi:hypothetical protein